LNPLASGDPHLSGHTVLGCEAVSTPAKCTISDGGVESGEEGGGEVCSASVHHPVQTLPAGGYGSPASPFTSGVVLDIVKGPLSMATADLTTFPPGEPGLFLKLHLSLVQLGKENIQCAESRV
ncbi:uncharacterized, partial [Tachysurus ichikawai]